MKLANALVMKFHSTHTLLSSSSSRCDLCPAEGEADDLISRDSFTQSHTVNSGVGWGWNTVFNNPRNETECYAEGPRPWLLIIFSLLVMLPEHCIRNK